MKITYIKLENVAGIMVGSDKKVLEISFEKSKNKIVSIQGVNGKGKTVLLSSLTPFATVTALDDRSSLSYIIPGKNGYKEIHYLDGGDQYIIKHYYKASKESHTVKSYFQLNGEELNENGNVTSFLSLVELHFGLTQEMMRLIRLGTNVSSFITLTPARRKEYIGKLIEEIEMYMKIYKKINEDIRVVRTLLTSNNQNLYNCHISDPVVEEEKLSKLSADIKAAEKDRDKIITKIGRIDSLMANNDIHDLRRKKQEAESSIAEFNRVESQIKENHLEAMTIDQLMKKRSDTADKRLDIQSRINSYRISIDNTLKTIERLELSVKKITSNNDIQSLVDAISSLRETIQSTSKFIRDFTPLGSPSDEVYQLLMKLGSFNQISNMIQSFGSRPIDVYLKLRREGKSVDEWLKKQMKRTLSKLNEADVRSLFDQVFQDDFILTPLCDTEFENCPYYRLHSVINGIKDKLDEDNYDDETLRYIQVISNNIDRMMNELDVTTRIRIPDNIRVTFEEKYILERMGNKLSFFDLSQLQEYLSILREYEIYVDNVNKLKQYERQFDMYQKSGVDTHLTEIKSHRESVEFYQKNIGVLQGDLNRVAIELEEIDRQIGLVTKYNDGKKYRKMVQSTLESTTKLLDPLESASSEKMELEFQLRQQTNLINLLRQQQRELDNKLNEYNRLLKEGKELADKHHDLTIIMESVSTKKGIPVIYMKNYLAKIQKLANNLLQLIYDDDLQLANFKVTQDTFEVPYVKNGTKIPDVKYASQSEVALITMALSFALANRATGMYNILLLDEIDAGLDEANRSAFLKMLYMQMNALKAEQVFIISHNLSQMVNVPMDCIKLSDTGMNSKLQNVIYE
ncbi:MAG: hypothetical protein NC548_28400 [Lachnospiraceae bacterium]|nr:hypothetical protein [Lachnospiraceae bacterium]MCM1232013.1 hypothetical protein [Ruminococcus flavefaciens]